MARNDISTRRCFRRPRFGRSLVYGHRARQEMAGQRRRGVTWIPGQARNDEATRRQRLLWKWTLETVAEAGDGDDIARM